MLSKGKAFFFACITKRSKRTAIAYKERQLKQKLEFDGEVSVLFGLVSQRTNIREFHVRSERKASGRWEKTMQHTLSTPVRALNLMFG